MCKLFIGADPALWQSTTRSVRIVGQVTSVRLEDFFWDVLSDIAKRDGLTLGQILTRFYNESIEEGHDLDNFASFLRVCCARFLALQLTGDIPQSPQSSIRALDAESILVRERKRNSSRKAKTQNSFAQNKIVSL
ncbi:MAG TPA: hypothetical protein ENK61_10410 [Devosia sp.]|nr:hypothetical protein [Devosia sp.]